MSIGYNAPVSNFLNDDVDKVVGMLAHAVAETGITSQRWPLKIGQSVKVGCTSQIRSDTHEYHTTQTLFSRVQG